MEKTKQTKIINLYGRPGVGKSTFAARLFYELKTKGVDAELITEYAKDLTWEGHINKLGNQPYVIAKQMHKQYRLLGKVDVVITDSPILLGSIHRGFGCTSSFDKWLLEVYHLFDNENFLLSSDHPYIENGRNETFEQSMEIENKLINLLNNNDIHYHKISLPDDSEQLIKYITRKALTPKLYAYEEPKE